MISVVASFVALNAGVMTFAEFMIVVNPALLALGLRDAI